ncbi:unnamed protein product [Rotaria sordida]|uniref:Uncharacterized protein n=1 Tax=Rotaria sordida TaxID=392033 RepID=A0A819RMX6_9BILA|nr:unnamed protein product [Rotaria sordida]
MLRRFIPVFNNVKRYYSISSIHYDSANPEPIHHSNLSKSSGGKSTDKYSLEYLQGLEKCKNAIREIENYSYIDFECDEPLPLDWSDLSDDDPIITNDASSMVNLFNKKRDTTNEQKSMYDKHERSFTSSQQFGNGHT